jgi:hypothetical protein
MGGRVPTRAAEQLLEDYDGRSLPWARPAGAPAVFETDRVLFGNGDNALEVAIASATRPGQPRAEDLRALFKKRQANRPAPVLLVVTTAGPTMSRSPRSSARLETLPRSSA